MVRLHFLQLLAAAASVLVAALLAADERREAFDADPGWKGFINRLVPEPARQTRQEFGHRETRRGGGTEPGEIGGWIQCSLTPAWYAKTIATRTLDDRPTAAGKFAVRRDEGGSGMLFGWFNKN
jgi:hypothetical protein